MTFQKKSWGAKAPATQAPTEAPQPPRPTKPTFVIKESEKTGQPFAQISFRTAERGRAGAMLMIFPSKFEGQFVGLAVNGWGRGMIPVGAEQVDIDGNTLKIDLGWLKIEATGDNVQELSEFLQYAAEAPKQSGFQQPPTAEPPAAPVPTKKTWRK